MTYAAQQDDSHQATITVARILQPKAPRKPAWIEGADGVRYSIWPDKLGQFREGETYEIKFQTSNGYHNIKDARAATKPSPAPEQFTGGRSNPPARSLSSAATGPQQQAQQPNGNGGSYYRPTSPKDSERMFTCSIINAFIQTGRIDCNRDTLAGHIEEIRAAYAMTFGQDDQ